MYKILYKYVDLSTKKYISHRIFTYNNCENMTVEQYKTHLYKFNNFSYYVSKGTVKGCKCYSYTHNDSICYFYIGKAKHIDELNKELNGDYNRTNRSSQTRVKK